MYSFDISEIIFIFLRQENYNKFQAEISLHRYVVDFPYFSFVVDVF